MTSGIMQFQVNQLGKKLSLEQEPHEKTSMFSFEKINVNVSNFPY